MEVQVLVIQFPPQLACDLVHITEIQELYLLALVLAQNPLPKVQDLCPQVHVLVRAPQQGDQKPRLLVMLVQVLQLED